MLEGWNEASVSALCRLYEEGKSCSEIATAIGKSRNAVISKSHRLNLHVAFPRKPKPACKLPPSRKHFHLSSRTTTPKNVPFPKMISKVPVKPTVVAEPAPPPNLPIRHTVFMLSDKTCRFPIGHPGTKDFYFCGHEPKEKSVYCPYHSRIAYQSVEERLAERRV